MPQAYDTGLAVSQRSALRAAAIAKLSPLLKANGLYVRTIQPFPALLQGVNDEDGLGRMKAVLNGQVPAILVALGDRKRADEGMNFLVGQAVIDLAIYVVSGNARDMVAGRLANDVTSTADITADPGIETMLEHVEQLLEGQDLGVDSIYEPLQASESNASTFEDFTVWEQLYKVKVDRDINPNRGILAIAQSIQASHELDGASSGVPDPQPPGSPANPVAGSITDLEAP